MVLLLPAAGQRPRPCAGTVAYVHSDRLVNLSGLDHLGATHSRTQIQLLQDDDVAPLHAYCVMLPERRP